ncbi:hypothetical protein LCGC14_1231500 [marine sediment metagenome]|uniref:Radical SAM core domain-containing protein n=1 Tax=marine sediment metagenome TaxID=412755 RepID=A0A0F9LCE9_9ZZZZ
MHILAIVMPTVYQVARISHNVILRMMRRRMIIVNPNHRNPSPHSAIEAPIWCAYLARKHCANILDAELEGLTVDETLERIGREPCILVAMGANPSASSTSKMGVINKLAKNLHFYHIAGLHPQSFHRNRRVRRLPWAEQLCGLTPAWDKIDFSKYKAHNWQCLDGSDPGNYGVIYTSFGCPFNCLHCNIHTLYKGVTYRDTQDVGKEIDYLVSRGVKNLKIADELFTLKPSHVYEICDVLEGKGLNVWAYAKAGLVKPEMLKRMKEVGINWLAYGFESANEGVLTKLGKKQSTEDMMRATEMTKEAGISVLGNFIFGLPDDDLKTMRETLDFAKELQCEYVNFYCAMAYPGSQLYKDTPKEDLPDKWEDYDQYSPNLKPLPTKYLTSQEVLEFRDKAFQEYFFKEDYIKMIGQKFGGQGVEQIRQMREWSPRGNDVTS